MASLVLLLAELLKHQNTDLLYSSPPPPTNSCGSAANAAAASGGANARSSIRSPVEHYKNNGEDFVEDVPEFIQVSVDLVWP